MREKLKWKQPKQLVKTTFFAAKLCSVLKLESAYPPKTEQWKVSFLSSPSPNLKPPEVGNISILFSQQCNLVNLDNSVSSYGYANCHIKKSPTVTLKNRQLSHQKIANCHIIIELYPIRGTKCQPLTLSHAVPRCLRDFVLKIK